MKPCPAIIAALPREVSALVKGWEAREFSGHVHLYTNGEAVVACAGMGEARAMLAVQMAMAAMPVTALVSVGLAGACDPALRVAEIVRPGVVVDSLTGERFEDPRFNLTLMTTGSIAGTSEKRHLYSSYRVSAVDMEAAAVARMARAYGLEFSAIKAVSDEAEFEMEGLARFATADGQFRETAFAMHTALRPTMWAKVIALGRNSNKAVTALTAALQAELDWYRKRS